MSKVERQKGIRFLGSLPTSQCFAIFAIIFFCFVFPALLFAQAPVIDNTGVVENPRPSWETRKQATTYVFSIPAPRGQITDRHGRPLAQMRLGHNLALAFPQPRVMDNAAVLAFARQQIALAQSVVRRDISMSDETILTHYRDRGLLPLDIFENLLDSDMQKLQRGKLSDHLVLRQTYIRTYPEGSLAAHIIGYTGREAPLSTRPIENNDLVFCENEGKEGIENSFNSELRGVQGKISITFDADGNKMAERISRQPVPGQNVVLTIDKDIQRIAENVLAKNVKRGAMVVVNVETGEILAMASHPTFDPNLFVPTVSQKVFQNYSDDPLAPMYPRAFRASYPPGSVFKPFVALAALGVEKITPKTTFSCPGTLKVGNRIFSNWSKSGREPMSLTGAMAQSWNTWFYQVGLKMGATPIIDYSHLVGFGRKTGIPIAAEATGNIPTDEYMQRVHNRRIAPGDIANMSIGQGDILISPLQMASAMAALATNGRLMQTRLVKQIQALDNKVVAAYPPRVRNEIPLKTEVFEALRRSMLAVTQSGTGKRGSMSVGVAAKTGTAQWGPARKERTAAWFGGYLPANKPRYAFAVVYESNPRAKAGGGSHAAPMIPAAFSRILALDKGKPPEKDDIPVVVNDDDMDESN